MRIDGRNIDCIAIGTSAGGVDAINTLMHKLQHPLSIPVVITLHTSPHSAFINGAFRAGSPAIIFKETEDKESAAPGTVYFAPADYHVLFESDGCLSLSADEPVHFARPSIDVMFESAVYALGARVLGILLTGANEDGARGLQAIHEAGGLTWVQSPEEALAPMMLSAAIARFPPSRVGSIKDFGILLSGKKL